MIKRFFSEYLPIHRRCSPNTASTYAEAFSLFLKYLQYQKKKRPEQVSLDDFSSTTILGFLKHLQNERGNGDRTRNARLSAIHSFINFLLIEKPALAGDVQGALSIPTKKTDTKILDYLHQDEIDAILESPDLKTWCGPRDQVLLTVMYNTGARVSEMVDLAVSNVRIETSGQIYLFGKGRKDRTLPLWKSTVKILRQWIRLNKYERHSPLFPNNRGGKMTRSAVAKRLSLAVQKAELRCSSLKRLTVSPHIIRHTTAMHLLQSGVDITVIAQWLGHESIETTHVYLSADPGMKEEALGSLLDPQIRPRRFQPQSSLLEYLDNV